MGTSRGYVLKHNGSTYDTKVQILPINWRSLVLHIRQLVLKLLSRCVRVALAFPQLSKLLRIVVRRFPAVESRLKAHVLGLPDAAAIFAAVEALPTYTAQLCDHAGWIHAFLVSPPAGNVDDAANASSPKRTV